MGVRRNFYVVDPHFLSEQQSVSHLRLQEQRSRALPAFSAGRDQHLYHAYRPIDADKAAILKKRRARASAQADILRDARLALTSAPSQSYAPAPPPPPHHVVEKWRPSAPPAGSDVYYRSLMYRPHLQRAQRAQTCHY